MALTVGLLTAELEIPGAASLKDKRSVVNGLLHRLTTKLKVSAAEVEALDQHRRAVIACTIVANDQKHVDRVLDACRRLLDTNPGAVLVDSVVEFL